MLLPYAVDFGIQLTWTVDGDLRQAGKLQKVAKETLFIAVEEIFLAVIFQPQCIDVGKINILACDQVDDLALILIERWGILMLFSSVVRAISAIAWRLFSV